MSVPQLLVSPDGAALIDTGFPGDASRIRRVMSAAGVHRTELKAILLTHGHLERLGRAVTGYRRPRIDVELSDGQLLPIWGGLRVLHLPGHTVGHCGFYSSRHNLLFSGDLWARFLMRTQISPRIFTDVPHVRLGSLRRARALGARWVVPGHFDFPNATRLRARFEQLCEDCERRARPQVI